MFNPSGKRAVYLFLGVALFGLAFLGAYAGTIPVPELSIEWEPPPGESRYTPNYDAPEGRELAFIYIGSSGCAASNRLFLPGAIKQLKLLVQKQARARGRSFVAIGVAKDWNVEAGLGHLSKFGNFDMVMSGRNWLNIGALKYMWEEIPGKAGTPQVVVISRRVVKPEGKGASYGLRDPELLARKLGTKEIRRWLEHGAPLPPLEAPAGSPPSPTSQMSE